MPNFAHIRVSLGNVLIIGLSAAVVFTLAKVAVVAFKPLPEGFRSWVLSW